MSKLRVVKVLQRLLVICFLFVVANSAKAGDLFGPVQPSGLASLERLNLVDYRLRWLALADTPLASLSSAYTNVAVSAPRRVAPAPAVRSAEAATLSNDLRSSVWTSGEAGFLYGRSAGGKYSFDTEQGYIFGTVGNDHIQISAGAAYQQWNAHGWRGR